MQMYNAVVGVERRASELDPDALDAVMERLGAFHAALGESRRGWASATISLAAESLAQATATAAAVVGQAYGAEPISCEVMTEKEFDLRQGWEAMPQLVSVSEAAQLLGVSRQRILQRITEKSLPAERVGRDWVIARGAVVKPAGGSTEEAPAGD